jgi:c-di-GMP-binding flagellar brake protein YcgR
MVIDGRFGEEAFFCRTKNISATGMMIETRKRLVEGARLTCQFYLPDSTRIQATGKIIRIIQQTSGGGDQQYGLMFTDIAPDIKQRLAEFVESSRRGSGLGGP